VEQPPSTTRLIVAQLIMGEAEIVIPQRGCRGNSTKDDAEIDSTDEAEIIPQR
jgi:hypothetical protein